MMETVCPWSENFHGCLKSSQLWGSWFSHQILAVTASLSLRQLFHTLPSAALTVTQASVPLY